MEPPLMIKFIGGGSFYVVGKAIGKVVEVCLEEKCM